MLRFGQKLAIPRQSTVIERASVVRHLNQSITANQVVVVTAQAGWGKTTMLSQWARSEYHRFPVAWYTLDKADRDPAVFLDYVVRALQPHIPQIADFADQLGHPVTALSDLYYELSVMIANVDQVFALVLDDFHLLEDEAERPGNNVIMTFLGTLTEYAPCCKLILATRNVPALPGLTRLIAHERAAVFDYTQLRWNAEEIQQLAGLRYHALLSETRATALAHNVDGWITAIVLSLKDAVNGDPLVSSDNLHVSSTSLFAFFDEQIIQPLTSDVQAFLEETSVLSDLSPKQCDKLRQRTDSWHYLDVLQRRGVFMTNRGHWSAYHGLLRECLLERLRRDPVRATVMFQRAGDLYRDDDAITEALDCYFAADALEAAREMLQDSSSRLQNQGQQSTLLAGLDQLAQRQLLPTDLLFVQAKAAITLSMYDRALIALQLIEVTDASPLRQDALLLMVELLTLKDNHTQAKVTLDTILFDDLTQAQRLDYHVAAGRLDSLLGDSLSAIDHFQQAEHMLGNVRSLPSERAIELLGIIHDHLGWAYCVTEQFGRALQHLHRAEACWLRCGASGRRASTLNNIGTIATQERRWAEAHTALETGISLAQQTGRRREHSNLAHSLGDLDLLEGRLADASTHFEQAAAYAQELHLASGFVDSALSAAWIAALQGATLQAGQWLDATAGHEVERRTDVRARWLLTHVYLHKPSAVDVLLAEGPHLLFTNTVERAAYDMVRNADLFMQHGSVSQTWQDAALSYLEQLPDAILRALSAPFQAFIQAAAKTSVLAQRIQALYPLEHTTVWEIRGLGDFVCTRNGQPCTLTARERALLLRVIEAGGSGVAVETLISDVWDGKEPSIAAIHKACSRLRQQTGLDIAVDKGVCAVWSGWSQIHYDVQQLERLLRDTPTQPKVDAVRALYASDFFLAAPSFAVAWAERRRAYIRDRVLDFVVQHARSYEEHNPRVALEYYQHALWIDGSREEIASQIMRFAGLLGNARLVGETYHHLSQQLRQLGLRPASATNDLWREYTR